MKAVVDIVWTINSYMSTLVHECNIPNMNTRTHSSAELIRQKNKMFMSFVYYRLQIIKEHRHLE